MQWSISDSAKSAKPIHWQQAGAGLGLGLWQELSIQGPLVLMLLPYIQFRIWGVHFKVRHIVVIRSPAAENVGSTLLDIGFVIFNIGFVNHTMALCLKLCRVAPVI